MGIESSGRTSSVAVVGESKFSEITQEAQLTHSETLLPQMKEVLKLAGAARQDIGAVAVSIGPGSFTGLRIGLAAAKALADGWKIPIIGIPTLLTYAYHFPIEGLKVQPMIDAQKGRAYVQRYEWIDGQPQALMEIEVQEINEAVKRAGELGGQVIICGDVCEKIKELPEGVKIAPMNLRKARAVNVGIAGRRLLEEGRVDDVMTLEPKYIRRSEAELLWERRHNAG